MKRLAPLLLAIVALYLTVWPHELGHSTMAYLSGCKMNWWQTKTSWFLWDSRGGDIDYACLKTRGATALALVDGAGIALNLILLGVALLLGRLHGPERYPWLFTATVFWGLSNYAEAFSYLVVNTLWLKSDMETVVVASGVSRGVWLLAGSAGAVVAGRALYGPARRAAELLQGPRLSARTWLWVFSLYVAVVGLIMAAARIVLM